MPKTALELKEKLLAEGRWGDFVRYRQDLKDKGMAPRDAQKAAVAHFFNDPPVVTGECGGKNPKPLRKRGRPRGSVKKKSSDSGVLLSEDGAVSGTPLPGADSISSPVVEAAESSGIKSDGPADLSSQLDSGPAQPRPKPSVKNYVGSLPPLPSVGHGEFDGRRASEVEVVRWVASNMQVEDPCSSDCPSAAAWGLLAQCRESVVARSDFWKTTYPKLLPTKSQMEQEQKRGPDEGRAKAVIEDLLRFGREARDGGDKSEPEASVIEGEGDAVSGGEVEVPGGGEGDEQDPGDLFRI